MGLLEVTRDGSGPALVWLHGFTQTRDSARRFRSILAADYEVLTLDLPGHGTAARVSASLEGAAELVAEAFEGRRAALGGYSMGGRLALHVALAHPELVDRLVVVSATAGIADPEERAARLRRDDNLATRIEQIGADAFLEEWLAQPLFVSLPPDPLDREARSHDAAGLADSLRRCGTGNQTGLDERLEGLVTETLVLAGGRDEKFVAAGTHLASIIPHARFEALGALGHAAHLEDPAAVAGRVRDFLSSVSPSTRS